MFNFRSVLSVAPVLVLISLLLAGCGGGGDLGAGFIEKPLVVSQQVASGDAVVSGAHPLASEAGLEILKAGGNAADAAAAVGFALAVVENSMSGLGGRAQLLLTKPDGTAYGVDAQTQLGSEYKAPWLLPEFSGIGVVGVPGVVAGLLKLHEAHGERPHRAKLRSPVHPAQQDIRLEPSNSTV